MGQDRCYNKYMKIIEISPAEFIQARKKIGGGSFLQSVEMYERYRAKGKEAFLVGAKEGSECLAVGLVMVSGEINFGQKGKKIFNLPRGPLMNYERAERSEFLAEFTKKLAEFLRKRGGMVVKISPNVARKRETDREGRLVEQEEMPLAKTLEKLGYKNLGEMEQVKWIYVKDFQGESDLEILNSLRGNHRRSIKYATERYGLMLRELKKEEELIALKQLTKESGERHGFSDPEVAYYQEMKRAFGERAKFMVAEGDEGRILEGKENGRKVVVAGAMFMEEEEELVYLFSGTSEKYRKALGAYLLQWWAIKRARAKKMRYNFYGTHFDDGVYQFKRGFRGEAFELVGTFILPLNFLGKVYCLKQKYQKFGRVE